MPLSAQGLLFLVSWAAARLSCAPHTSETTVSSQALSSGVCAGGQAVPVPGHGATLPARDAGFERRRLPGHLTRCTLSLCSSENHKKVSPFTVQRCPDKDDVKSVGRLILLQYRNSQNQMFKLSYCSSIRAPLLLLSGAVCKIIYNAVNVFAAACVSKSCWSWG